jgi:hypothetical protein
MQHTVLTRALPTVTLIEAWPVPLEPPVLGNVVAVVVEPGVVVDMVCAVPPETAWMVAMPERLSDVKFTRAIPFLVLP